MKKIVMVLAIVSCLALVAGSAQANVIIGTNFSSVALAPGDVAGYVPVASWNNAGGKTGSIASLLDQNAAATGVSITWSLETANDDCTDPTAAATAGDQKLFAGGARSMGFSYQSNYQSSQWRIDNLNAAFPGGYTVYIYLGDNGYSFMAGSGSMYISQGSDFTTAYINDPASPPASYYSKLDYSTPNNYGFNGTYTVGTNYVASASMANDSICVTTWVTGKNGTTWGSTEVPGIQIVGNEPPTPEPACLGLIGVALLGLRKRRS